MKEGWKYCKLGDILDVKHGKDQKEVASPDGKYPIYGSGGTIMGYANAYLCEEGTTILGRKGTIDKPMFMNCKFWNIDTAFGLVPKDGNNPKLIYYICKTIDWKSLDSGAAKPSLTQSIIKNQVALVPPLSEQQSIVTYLDTSFSLIDSLAENAKKALENAKALFQAELNELISENKINCVHSLEVIATDMYRGSGIKRDQVTEEGISCVRYGEIYTSYNYHFDTCKSHTDEDAISPKKYFEHGDILFAITGESVEEIGKSIAYMGHEKCLSGGDIVVMKHNQNPRYLSYALATDSAIRQKGMGKTKLKVVHTNVPSLKAIRVPIPSLEEQERIANTLDTLSQLISQLEQNYNKTLDNCQALKQALLRETFE